MDCDWDAGVSVDRGGVSDDITGDRRYESAVLGAIQAVVLRRRGC